MIEGPKPGKLSETSTETTKLKLTYDAWNRMVEVKDTNDATLAKYKFDGLNRRIAKLIPNGENWDRTDYYYYNEDWQVVEEYHKLSTASTTKGDHVNARFVWSSHYIDAPACRWYDEGDTGSLVGPRYFSYDANFNVTALVNSSGTVQERYIYDVYGKLAKILSENWSTNITWANGKKNELLYCG